jgi:hypothetical protein
MCDKYDDEGDDNNAQYWQKNNTLTDMIECVLNYTLTYARKEE